MKIKDEPTGLSFNNDQDLLKLLLHQAKDQDKRIKRQNLLHLFIVLSIFAFAGGAFFLATQFLERIQPPDENGSQFESIAPILDNLTEQYRIALSKMESSIDKKVKEMAQKSEKEKQALLLEVRESYQKIIKSMDLARQRAEQQSLKYKKQIDDYEIEIFILKKRARSVSGEIAKLQNEHSDLLEKHKKLTIQNKTLQQQNKKLKAIVSPYLNPEQHQELEKALDDDS